MANMVNSDHGDGAACSKIKHDWYQTETSVVVTILLKNTKEEDFKITFSKNALNVTVKLPSGSEYNLDLDLLHDIVPAKCTYKISPSKIEVKLNKRDDYRWTSLEGDGNISEPKIQPIPRAFLDNGPGKYPSSALKSRDWDRVVGDITKEEENERPEGEAALNSLFQRIYSEGSDEVKKAMNKSFQESGGTVLSTNWNEVGHEKVGIKAPDGMEWKKWDA